MLRSIRHNSAEICSEQRETIPVAARSNAWVGSSSLFGIAGSNSAEGMDVSLLSVVCCQEEVSESG